MKILVTDDDPIFLELIRAILQSQGWEVLAAVDAMQAMMYAMRVPQPRVILLDINMPGGTGMAALRRLKQSTKTAPIPVVVVSGTSDPTVPKQVRALGAVGFIQKPVDPLTLDVTLRELLELPATGV